MVRSTRRPATRFGSSCTGHPRPTARPAHSGPVHSPTFRGSVPHRTPQKPRLLRRGLVVVCDDAPFRARGGELAAALPGDARSFAQDASARSSVEVHRSLASTRSRSTVRNAANGRRYDSVRREERAVAAEPDEKGGVRANHRVRSQSRTPPATTRNSGCAFGRTPAIRSWYHAGERRSSLRQRCSHS